MGIPYLNYLLWSAGLLVGLLLFLATSSSQHIRINNLVRRYNFRVKRVNSLHNISVKSDLGLYYSLNAAGGSYTPVWNFNRVHIQTHHQQHLINNHFLLECAGGRDLPSWLSRSSLRNPGTRLVTLHTCTFILPCEQAMKQVVASTYSATPAHLNKKLSSGLCSLRQMHESPREVSMSKDFIDFEKFGGGSGNCTHGLLVMSQTS
jgi:hypothetical protein